MNFRSELTLVQLVPLLVVRNTSPYSVAAMRFVPQMARALTLVFVKPELTAIQLVPLFVERKTPPNVPTKRFVSETARDLTYVYVKPVFTAVQLVPLLVERKIPPPEVPAKRFVSETAKELTEVFVKPVFIAVQLVPLLVERKTPPPFVPAKRFAPETTKDWTYIFVKPAITAAQLVPLLVERKTPAPQIPAKRYVPETAKELTEPPQGPFVCTHWADNELRKRRVAARIQKMYFIPVSLFEILRGNCSEFLQEQSTATLLFTYARISIVTLQTPNPQLGSPGPNVRVCTQKSPSSQVSLPDKPSIDSYWLQCKTNCRCGQALSFPTVLERSAR